MNVSRCVMSSSFGDDIQDSLRGDVPICVHCASSCSALSRWSWVSFTLIARFVCFLVQVGHLPIGVVKSPWSGQFLGGGFQFGLVLARSFLVLARSFCACLLVRLLPVLSVMVVVISFCTMTKFHGCGCQTADQSNNQADS